MKNTYSEMKDSGIAWIGAVPSNWGVLPARTAFYEVKEKNFDGKYTRQLSFRYGQIVDKVGNSATTEAENETATAYRVVTPKTIMINGLNLNYDFISQRVAMVKEHGIITSAYLAVKSKEELMISEYALYLFKSYDGKQVFHGHGSGVRKTLKFSDFREIPVVIPPLPEQTAIAAYLDEKCGTIDEIIAEAKASIEEYKAWKSSVIFEAVTKGLDPHAEMKDSGVEWIGKVPQHWRVSTIKKHFAITLGKMLANEKRYADDSLESYICAANIKWSGIDTQIQRQMWFSSEEKNEYLLRQNDLLVMEGGSAGTATIYNNEFSPCYIQNSVNRCRGKNGNLTKFLYYWMFLTYYSGHIERICNKATIMHLTKEKLGNLPLVVIPIAEQEAIVAFLDEKCAAIDGIIAEKEALIADMEAYKKSLIFETVTGKRKVC